MLQYNYKERVQTAFYYYRLANLPKLKKEDRDYDTYTFGYL